jgi:hypothetical protein
MFDNSLQREVEIPTPHQDDWSGRGIDGDWDLGKEV